ncbi:MAG TPA: hypothetical protein VIL95_03125 [Bacillota bacterium]
MYHAAAALLDLFTVFDASDVRERLAQAEEFVQVVGGMARARIQPAAERGEG